jgi:hypothetical protein
MQIRAGVDAFRHGLTVWAKHGVAGFIEPTPLLKETTALALKFVKRHGYSLLEVI